VAEPLLEIKGLKKYFPLKRPITDLITGRPQQYLKAVDHVGFSVQQGETLGLVGESGCGKSTLARTIVRIYRPDEGDCLIRGVNFAKLSDRALRPHRRDVQMIFQDPYSSLNPRMSVRDVLAEELMFHKLCDRSDLDKRILEVMGMVGLPENVMNRMPSEFSGGQRQRIGIARAIALKPGLIIADEPVSALDVSIQAQVINLLGDLQQELNLTLLFISHDLRVVRHISHRIAVMYLGKIVELAETEPLFAAPLHPYTDVLLRAEPNLDPRVRKKEVAIEGEPPSPIKLPSGCRFHPRCPYKGPDCDKVEPELREVCPGRCVACHYPLHLDAAVSKEAKP
jgi:oligopeptide/dipeptide ABC transporter ATP-binding protein